jgi:hypothetical protein
MRDQKHGFQVFHGTVRMKEKKKWNLDLMYNLQQLITAGGDRKEDNSVQSNDQ